MALNEEKRNYNFGDDVLMQKADKLVLTMQRDADAFASRNVDAPRRDEIAKTNQQFKELPTDPELLGLITTATEAKDADSKNLKIKISSVRNMAETKYGKTGKYKIFNFGELSALSDEDLFRTAKRVVRVGRSVLSDLASEGLTDDLLNEIAELANGFDDKIDKVAEAVENRDIQSQERVRMGNRLWDLMVKYANIGKSLFEFTDEARYNDYVLTEGSASNNGDDAPTPPTT